MLHEILSTGKVHGAAQSVFGQFCEEVVRPTGGDLYLTVRKDNVVACDFYERNGMRVAGTISWSGGKLPGVVYRKNFLWSFVEGS